jgi:hypothetical protein
MIGADIRNLMAADARVFLHYTNEEGFKRIKQEGVIRQSNKFAVYFTREALPSSEVGNVLFIGAPTHEGRGSHVFALRLDPGILLEEHGWGVIEYITRQRIKLGQHEVIYAGRNPF